MVRYFKGSAGISITTLLLPDQSLGEGGCGGQGERENIRGSQRQVERVQTQ